MSSKTSVFVYGALLCMVCVLVPVYAEVFARTDERNLTLAFLDVGQGDAIFIQAPNGTQVLIDGGKGGEVLSELATLMPFSDHTIDTVIATHPDLDHIGGLPELFERYDIDMFIESGVADEGADNTALHRAVEREGLTPVLARAGTTLVLAEGVYLEFLFPDREVSALEANTGSIVARLSYGDTSVLLTGDSPTSIEEYLVSTYAEALRSTMLKLGHHGSKTSSSELFLGYVDPTYGIISAGCDNAYGHPHEEILDRLETFEVKQLSTCELGTIVFESDGSTWTQH